MIRYKVVKLYFVNRLSCYAKGNYQLEYRKNTIVTAKEGTLGIAVFERKYQAKDFLKKEFSPHNVFEIIRVHSIGRGKRYHFACNTQESESLSNFYHMYKNNLDIFLEPSSNLRNSVHVLQIPDGTIFYQQVKVLE